MGFLMEPTPAKHDIRKLNRHNRLVEAHYELTLVEQKILYFAIANANITQEIQPLEIGRQQLADFCHVGQTNITKTFKDVTEKLQRRTLELHGIDSDEWIRLNWTSMASYRDGKFYIQLNKDLAPYITHLRREFLNMDIKSLMLFKSTYAMRIYELCLQRIKIKNVRFSLKEFRACVGAIKKSYDELTPLRKRVIEPALKEINEKTPYRISVKYDKDGKKVVGLEFSISLKDNVLVTPVHDHEEKQLHEENHDKIQPTFLVQPALSNIVSLVRKIEHCEDVRPFFTNGAEYTLKNMQYVLMHQPKNIQQYFNAAIRENYAGAAVRHVKPDCPICHGYGIKIVHPEGIESEKIYITCECGHK